QGQPAERTRFWNHFATRRLASSNTITYVAICVVYQLKILIDVNPILHPDPDPAILITASIIELKADVTNAQSVESTYPTEIWITEIMAGDCQHARSGARKRLV